MTTRLEDYEARELAEFILKVENPDEEDDVTNEALFDKWGIDLDTFEEIANAIYKTIDFGLSPLTHKAFVGFSSGNIWLAKKDANHQFISAILNWSTEGEDIPENSKGFIRTITSNGKPEFEILIRKPKKE